MKKIFFLSSTLLCTLLTFSQSQRLQLFEEFTGENCGPCAATNPGLNTLLNANEDKIVSIKYMVDIPSGATLYNQTAAETGPRRSYYSINSAPFGTHDGGTPAHAGALTQAMINTEHSVTSPFDIHVRHWLNVARDTVFVQTVIKATQAISNANLVAHNVIIERDIYFTVAPGNNGEKHFEGPMRKMLPGVNGTALTTNWAVGDSVVMNLSWRIASYVYDKNQIAVVSFVQDNATKNVKQAGYSEPLFNLNITDANPMVKNVAASTPASFKIGTYNEGASSETFSCVLTAVQPLGWSNGFVVNGTSYSTSAAFTVNSATADSIIVNVTPGATTGVGSYNLKFYSVTNPSAIYRQTNVHVISGVTDLVVSSTGMKGGTGPQTAAAWDSVYTSGLAYAGNTTSGKTTRDVLVAAFNDNAMTGVTNIYYNIGWTFPGLTDEVVNGLTTFLNSGGHLFVSGQDIGWDTWDAAGNGNATTKAFYTNFLNATYVNDGAATSTTLSSNSNDPVFMGTASSPISTTYYGSGTSGPNLFPDEITPGANGTTIFYYNTGTAKPAGVRATNGTYKVVYITVGMEQLSNVPVRNTIIKLSHDWFNGIISSTAEFDKAMLSIGQNYPNPGNLFTIIPLVNVNKPLTFDITDLMGRIIYSEVIQSNANQLMINTSSFAQGMYMYRISDNNSVLQTKPMQIVH
jgi:hypothetical protein